VAAYDSINTSSPFYFTQFGAKYPIIENNSQLGVLVGVSSGGTIRMPVGDIVWRVDDKPFRTLRMMDNPTAAAVAGTQPAPSNASDKAMQDSLALAQKFMQAGTATATVASGRQAKEMLSEMIGGKGLIFRAAAAAPAYGLPSPATSAVGQYTNEGLRPIPIDESFHQSLAACGISQ
jgi:hypothetical protein